MLVTGSMVKLSQGTLMGTQSYDPGTIFYVHRSISGNIIYLYADLQSARAGDAAGLEHINQGVGAKFDVVCPLHDRDDLQGHVQFSPRKEAVPAGSGEVCHEISSKTGNNVEVWIEVNTVGGDDSNGWVGPLRHGGRCGPLRIVRPFTLDLFMYSLQYDNFVGDACSRLELLIDLKPEQMDKMTASDEVEKDDHGFLRLYRLKFRERSVRNAYWRTMQDKLQGRVSLDFTPTTGSEPWAKHAGTTLRIAPTSAGCLVHIWDQPR